VPPGQVNALNLQGSIGLEDIDPLFPQKPLSPLDINHTNQIRRRRDTEKVIKTKIMIDRDGHRRQVVTMVNY
jgi:hypothetical protein